MQETFEINVYDEDSTRRGPNVFAYSVASKTGGNIALGYGVSKPDCVNVAACQIRKYLHRQARAEAKLKERNIVRG